MKTNEGKNVIITTRIISVAILYPRILAIIGIKETTGTELNKTAVGLINPLNKGENHVIIARVVPIDIPPKRPTTAIKKVCAVFSM